MPEQNDIGASYLAALKRSANPEAAGTARASDSPPPTETPPLKAVAPGRTGPVPEKRRSPRYRCQGSALLRELQRGVATWAMFSDISLHGCYVEAAAGYPPGSILTLRIEVNNFRVEAIGELRVTYPGLGMGISSTQIADEDRGRLRELVRSISPPSVIIGARPADRVSITPLSSSLPAVANPSAALQAIQKFFEDRHVMGREEFMRILRNSQP